MIISMLNTKGGAGKTTIVINLAMAFKRRGINVLLVDSDPQGSARDWHEAGDGSLLDVVALDRLTLDKDVKKFQRQYDYIFIDGTSRLTALATKAILCSEVVLVPVMPSPYDIWATAELIEVIRQRQDVTDGALKSAFVVSRKIANTKIGKAATEALSSYNMPILNGCTHQRVIYPDSAGKGMTVFQSNDEEAKSEINNLANELLEFIK